MNKVIEITIRNKVARIASSPIIVGKNKDYIVRFDFDEDWDKYDTKTARFSQDSEYQDIIFAGNECSMPALDGGKVVEIGVYAGDISTTTPAYLKVQKSIIDDDGVPADPQPDVYAQIMERLNELEAPAAVLYTEQNLTDKQKAQARDNIGVTETGSGVDISLGIRGASAGQAPAVKSVDESGVPIEWEAVDFPSGAFVVNLTMGGDGSITADKTFAEIKAAYDGGKMVTAKLELGCVPLISIDDSIAIFQVMAETNLLYFQCETQDGSDTWDIIFLDMATAADARSLGITGATAGQIIKVKSVDASGKPTKWEAIEMPSGGTDAVESLGITGASAGQVPVVNSVDKNGVPNGWGAGDFPSWGGSSAKEWKLLRKITVPEDPSTDESGVTWTVNDDGAVTGIEFDTDKSGNSFSCEELSITGVGVCSGSGRLDYYVRTEQICAWNGQQQAALRSSWAWIRRLGSHWQVIGTIASANRWVYDMVTPSMSGFNNGGETNISSVTALGLRGTQSYNAGYVFTIWGR